MDEFSIGPIQYRDQAEFDRFSQLKRESWSDWYEPELSPIAARRARAGGNATAACLPHFLREVRDARDRQVAWLFSCPIWWSGAAEGLQTLIHHDTTPCSRHFHRLAGAAFAMRRWGISWPLAELARRVQARKVGPANSTMFMAMFVRKGFQGRGVAGRILDDQKEQSRALGFRNIVAPFRPSEYGRFKRSRNLGHSHETFVEYCNREREDGLPQDAWLRTLHRHGMKPLRAEARCFTLTKSLDEFDAFRNRYRSDDWYEPSPGVWECGVTQTWFVDEGRRSATSVEPNLWGSVSLDEASPGEGRSKRFVARSSRER